MEFQKIALNPQVSSRYQRVEHLLNWALREKDRTLARVHLGGRKAPYDDEQYEFLGGPAQILRTKHYEKSLRLLWKAEQHAPYLGFRDCTSAEREVANEAMRQMPADQRAELAEIGSADFRAMLNREYTPREKEAVVSALSAVGHGEAYAWLVSAELLGEVESTGARSALTMQVLEEAKHFLVLRELIRAFDVPVPRLCATEYLLLESVLKAKGTDKLFGMNVVVEGIALSLFGAFSGFPGLSILRLFHLDESRHTALPSNYLREFPLSERTRTSALSRARRFMLVLPALGFIPQLEPDFAELGIDICEFGGSVIRKIVHLSERNGYDLPWSGDRLLEVLDVALNKYCEQSRPEHQTRNFSQAETTRDGESLRTERAALYD